MFKFLKRLFETPSGDYGSLMDSRDPEVHLSQTTINTIVEALRPILLPAMIIEQSVVENDKLPQLPAGSIWPTNKKDKPLHYQGTISSNEFKVVIFQHEDGLKKDHTNLQYFYFKKNQWHELEELSPTDLNLVSDQRYKQSNINSLPIWEEIIHRYPEIHKLIVKLAPNHPWTLYKRAKKILCDKKITQQINGYPQWTINDIDFRKIKELTFLFQIEDLNHTVVHYYFTDGKEIQQFIQRQ
ncbi:hypothetical protein [Nonlabens ulvanivorans]|uniref:hypothetical protein n=1 Tax=Nonlabens ulvanivorans TaxID=906888 RepID=UPI002942C7FE|nr:hypothetical protein [Nonlabens ulvanivorans]WOI23448.1 hypothetical protein R1T42_03130 [Nonlabens ulvanivorans]